MGFTIDTFRPKNWNKFTGDGAPNMDLVITVCRPESGETCPVWPNAALRANWEVEDLEAAEQADWEVAFQTTFNRLKRRAVSFFEQSFEAIDKPSLTAALIKIGTLQ